MSNDSRSILRIIVELLRTRGVVEPYNVIRAIYHIADERFDIKGVLPLDLLNKDLPPFEQIFVTLPIPSPRRLRFTENTPEYRSDSETLVFYSGVTNQSHQSVILFYRPGLWERYLTQLNDEDIADSEENRKLNNTRVDDSKLFSEFLSPDDAQ